LRVERNDWRGHITTTTGERLRYVPMTKRLQEAMRQHRHLRGRLVFSQGDGGRPTESALKEAILRAMRRANLRCAGPRMLRHTFCSHLAMRGASPRAIQELAGDRDFATTQRYMHLSPAAVQSAIQLLEQSASSIVSGDIAETGNPAFRKVNE